MSACKSYVGNEGTKIKVTLVDCDEQAINISSATIKKIIFSKPDASDPTQKEEVEKTLDFVTDGTDGALQYIAEAGFMDVKGSYKGQAYVEMPTGKWYATTIKFTVANNITI